VLGKCWLGGGGGRRERGDEAYRLSRRLLQSLVVDVSMYSFSHLIFSRSAYGIVAVSK
jgi:hypothetical protein